MPHHFLVGLSEGRVTAQSGWARRLVKETSANPTGQSGQEAPDYLARFMPRHFLVGSNGTKDTAEQPAAELSAQDLKRRELARKVDDASAQKASVEAQLQEGLQAIAAGLCSELQELQLDNAWFQVPALRLASRRVLLSYRQSQYPFAARIVDSSSSASVSAPQSTHRAAASLFSVLSASSSPFLPLEPPP